MMAFKLERAYTKDEILELYLNIAYFGKGAYGVEAAARAYFGKSAGDLTLEEGATLAAILKSPTNYAPHKNMQRCLERRNLVLSEMLSLGFITEEAYTLARAKAIQLEMCIRDRDGTEVRRAFG